MHILFPNKRSQVHTKNITFQQAKIEPSEAIISPEHHWETPRLNMYGTVVKSDQGYEMFYQCGNALRIGYAQSDDGLTWQKPLINATDLSADAHDIILKKHAQNIVDKTYSEAYEITNLVAGYHMPSVIYEAGSDKPYKMFAFGEGGYRALFSHNGKQFDEYPKNPVIELLSYKNPVTEKYWCSDVSPCFLDNGIYHAMVKTYELDEQQRTRRCVGYSKSLDFENWEDVHTVWIPGAAEDKIAQDRGYQWADFYGLCPFRYGDILLGFLWLFEIEHELPNGTHLGKIEVFLAYSSDGVAWQRLADKPLIPWDLNFGEDGGMVTTPCTPIFDETEIKLYYSDSNYEHGFHEKDFKKDISAPIWVARCAQLKKERIVGAYSVDGEINIDISGHSFSAIRLNLDCTAGNVFLAIKLKDKIILEKCINEVDQTDYLLEGVAPCFASMDASEPLELVIKLNNACIFAIELIV